MVQMDPALKQWLRDEVYPKLSHDQIFAMLPGYTKAEFSETRYADCPRCHRQKNFYMPENRPIGNCNHCHTTITWWAYLRYDHTEQEAITTIAALAGVDPLDSATSSDPIFR